MGENYLLGSFPDKLGLFSHATSFECPEANHD